METTDTAIFERMAKAQEEIARLLKEQQPNKVERIVGLLASIATVLGVITIIQIIINLIGG